MLRKLFYRYRINKYIKKGLTVGTNTILINPIGVISEPFMVEIGDNVLISSEVDFITHDGSLEVLKRLNKKYENVRKLEMIKIGNNCFIGRRVILLPGVEVGDNCIVGAGSIVTKKLEPNSVYAGVPAKYICSIDNYGKKILDTSTEYPRELDKDRNAMMQYFLGKR